MTSSEANKLRKDIDGIGASMVILKSNVEALLQVTEEIARAMKVSSIEGLPIHERYLQIQRDELDRVLTGIDDQNPGVAAQLQQMIDTAKAKLDGQQDR